MVKVEREKSGKESGKGKGRAARIRAATPQHRRRSKWQWLRAQPLGQTHPRSGQLRSGEVHRRREFEPSATQLQANGVQPAGPPSSQ